jgi:carbonic anhydrase
MPETSYLSSQAQIDAMSALLQKNEEFMRDNEYKNPITSIRRFKYKDLALHQSPKTFWIGCSDSRVPETTILKGNPGDYFVHRNVANIVSPTDFSLMAAIKFAVDIKEVKQIIICGSRS